MKKHPHYLLIATLLLFTLNAQGQCPGGLTCQSAPIACGPSWLNGMACTTLPFANAGQIAACGQAVATNIQWWSFVGDGTWVDITITIGNCPGATIGSPSGIEAGVIPYDCGRTNWFFWVCDSDCDFPPNNTITISGPALMCESYYLWIDGCPLGQSFAICDFTLAVASGTAGPVEIPTPLPPLTVTGTVCVCGEVEVCIPEEWGMCTPKFRWFVDDIPTGGTDNCENVIITSTMPVTICVEAFTGNPDLLDVCSLERQCTTLVAPPVEERMGFGITDICYEDQPFDWHGTLINSSCISPPCSIRTQKPDGCCVDSLRQFNFLPRRDIGERDTFFCMPGAVVTTEDGRVWANNICEELITFPDPFYRCDTSYYLTINYFQYFFGWTLDCGGCAGELSICPNVTFPDNCLGNRDVQISLDWTELTTGRSYGKTLGDECINVKDPGMYCFELTAFIDGKACDVTWFECFEVTTDYVPDTPNLTGDTIICADPFTDYFIDLPPDICDVFWSIQSGGGVIQSPNTLDSSHIVVDWSARAGNFGTVCVHYTTDCGESKDSCLIVQFLEGPKPFSGQDSVFCQLNGTFDGMEDLGGMWSQISGPGAANITNLTDINSNLSVPQIGTYTFVWEEENTDCRVSDTVVLSFSEPPTIGPLDTFCIRASGKYHFGFSITGGQPPYQIVSGGGRIVGTNYMSDTIISNLTRTVFISDQFGCISSIAVTHDCDCGNQLGELATDTIDLCGEDMLACIDYDAMLQILNPGQDTVMFVLYAAPGDLRGSQIIQQNQLCFSFNAATMNFDQVYYLGVVIGPKDGGNLVDYDAGCVLILEGQPVIWREAPTPDAGVDIKICASSINLDGNRSIGTSQYQWLNHPVVNILDRNDLKSDVQIGNDFGTYDFILEERNGPCVSYDTVQITFNENPEGDPEEICVDLVNFRFIVKFEILKGTPPYIILSGGGSINPATNMYCSDTFPDLTMYTITIEDANGCQFTFTDQHKCDCGDTDPGTMGSDAKLCGDECIKIYSNGSEKLAADEEAFYILHEGSGSVVINEIRRQVYNHLAAPPDTIVFCFDPATMIAGKTYYISRLTIEQSSVDDPCARLSTGQAVTWNAEPNTDAGPDQDVCGLQATLSATASVGTGMWTVLISPASSNVMLSALTANGPVTVDQYGEYTFIWEENNDGCMGRDTIVINFHDYPQIDNISFVCDNPPDRYQIIITISGGEESSWNMTGNSTFTKNNKEYSSDWINSTDGISFCITDFWDCNQICIDTTYECACISDAGLILADDKLCLDECITLVHNNVTADANDVIVFILHDGDANTIGPNIIGCQSSLDFCFDAASMTPNVTYFITPAVGNSDMSACVDFADRCTNVGLGIPITWYEYPTAIAESGMTTFTCDTDSIALDGTKSNGPGTITYQWTALVGALCNNTTSAMTWACASGTYILTVTDPVSGCTSMDTITIVPDTDIPFADAGADQLITCDNRTVTLNGSNSDIDPDILLTWCDPSGTSISNNAIIMVDQPGVYTLKVRNILTDCADEKTVTVTADLLDPTAMIDIQGQLSCSDSAAVLIESGSLTQGGIRIYNWFTNDGNIVGLNSGANININEPGTYFLEIVDDQNGCRDTISITVLEGDNTFELLDLSSISPTCVGGSDGEITVDGVVGGVAPYQYSINGQGFNSGTVFSGLSAGDFTITVMDDNGCEYDTLITLDDPNGIGITAKDDLYVDEGEDITFDTLVLSVSGTTIANADSIIWYSDDSGRRIGTNNNAGVVNILKTETFRVELYKDGCISIDLITIYVTEINIYVPNVLNSGSTLDENSKMYIYGSKGKIRDIVFLRIYDRWGELIYQSNDLGYDQQAGRSNDGWDGKFNGENVLPGVYIYHLRAELRSGKFRDESGDVTLIK